MSHITPENQDKASAQSAELFHLIVENVKDYAIFMTDTEGLIVSWNPGVERLLGFTESEIIGKPINIIFTPEDIGAGTHEREMKTALRKGCAEDKRWHQRKDGTRFWANGMVMPLKRDDGSLRGFAKIMRDDTEQRLSETRLRESEVFSRSILESSADCIKILDLDGKLVSMNTPGLCIMEIDDFHDFQGRTWIDFWNGDEHESARLAIESAKHGETARFSGFTNTAKGTRKFWDVVVSPILDENGNPKQILSVSRDISDQKQTEDSILESNQRINSIFESITDAFFSLDRKWCFNYLNRQAEPLLQRRREDLLDKNIWEEFPDAVGTTFETQYRRAVDDRTSVTFEEFYPPLDTWFEVRAYPSDEGLSVYFHNINERRQAEELLRQSEERYRTLFNSIDEGFCVIEVLINQDEKATDYRFLEINPAFAKLTGISAEAAISGKTVREIVPNLEEKWFEIYGRVALTGESIRFAEGSEALERWFDVYALRVGEPEQAKVAILFNNITERKQSELTLRRAEERYRALIEATATSVWHADPEGALTFVDESWTAVTGQSIPEILKSGWLDAVHPDDREPTVKIWLDALQNKTLYSTEFRILTTTGAYRWFAVSAVPIFNENGNIREWVGSNIDINARKRAENERTQVVAQLEVERARLAYIFNKAPAFVAVLSGAEHAFELTNPAYLQLIGHRNLLGKTVREALPELTGQGYFELLDKVYETGEPFIGNEMAVELQYAPNSPLEKRFVNFVFQPIFGSEGKATGIFVHGVDITEQVEARQEAENANRLKDEFLATLSHELRTPLNAILGWSKILQKNQLDESGKEKALEIIQRSAYSQNQLIEDILDVSRIVTGKLRLDVRAVQLEQVIMAAVDTARPGAEAKNIRLQMLLDPTADVVSGDPDRLQQVIWNLLSNAIKFTPKNGRIQVRLERINSHVEVSVSDTGKGIEPEFLPYVFDRFRQSDGSMSRRQGGLGLGLAIVRQLVELHGGTVSVVSEGSDQGTTFTVSLPLLPVRREPGSTIPRVHPTAGKSKSVDCPPELADLSVLIVDDEIDSRELLNFILDSCGAESTTASSASEAFEIIKQKKFDVMISDIGMPEEDGFTLIRKIRELPAEQGGNIPAIALTAYARSEDRVQALRSGFQLHIAKPVDEAELIAAVSNLRKNK